MNSSMEPSIKKQKIQAMEKYKKAKLLYNLALYSLSSIITCFFVSSPIWLPSISNYFFSSFPNAISFCFNAKCFFVVGNLIVLILVGETKLRQSSSSTCSDIYDEYVARSRSHHHNVEEKKEIKAIMAQGEVTKKKGMKGSKSEVWGESWMVGKKEEKFHDGEKIKMGMRSSKSEVWGESGMVKMEKVTKGRKEEKLHDGETIKMGMRSSKSAVWGESGAVKMEKNITKGKKEEKFLHEGDHIKMGMRSTKSAVWGESGAVKMEKITKGKNEEKFHEGDQIKMGMRSSKSAVWGESGEVKMEKITKGKKEGKKFLHEGDQIKTGMRSSKSVVWSEGEKAKKEEHQVINTKTSMNIDEVKKMGMRGSKSAVWSEREIVERENKGKGIQEEEQEEKKMGMRSCKSEVWSEREIVRLGKNIVKEEDVQLNMLNKRVEDFIARVNKQRLREG